RSRGVIAEPFEREAADVRQPRTGERLVARDAIEYLDRALRVLTGDRDGGVQNRLGDGDDVGGRRRQLRERRAELGGLRRVPEKRRRQRGGPQGVRAAARVERLLQPGGTAFRAADEDAGERPLGVEIAG